VAAEGIEGRDEIPDCGGGMKFNANFWKWFKKSKIVDSNGEPQIMRHGSVVDFYIFEKSKIIEEDYDAPFNGFWFTSDKFASPAFANPKFTKNVYLSIQNPAKADDWLEARKTAKKEFDKWEVRGARSFGDATRMVMQDRGFDGAIWRNIPQIDVKRLESDLAIDFEDARGTTWELRC